MYYKKGDRAESCHLFWALRSTLLALMSVLSQSLLTLVRRHLVSFMLLSVWHNLGYLWLVLLYVYTFSDCKGTKKRRMKNEE